VAESALEPPTINLGVIQRNGQVWTDVANAHAPMDLSHAYIEQLASIFGMDIEKEAFKGAWHVRTNGRAPRITELSDKLGLWGVGHRAVHRRNAAEAGGGLASQHLFQSTFCRRFLGFLGGSVQ
jgi:hypothetical protein